MKRRVLKLCLFLLLGAIVNIAVAWGCAAWAKPQGLDLDFPYVDYLDRGSGSVAVVQVAGFGACEYGWEPETGGYPWQGEWQEKMPFPSWWPTWSRMRRFGKEQANGKVYEFASGCPAFSLVGVTSVSWSDGQGVEKRDSQWSIPLQVTSGPNLQTFRARCLPLLPLWPGFAINTVFYAAVLWLLFAAPFQLRCYCRIKRGLCSACAYPIGSSDVCTECGKPVTTKSVEPVT